jgi:lysophospholipase L1-like esterase
MKNDVFYPELPSGRMDEFNQNAYAKLLLAEGDSWFAWGYLNLRPSPNVLTSMRFAAATATLSYAYSGHTSGDMARMAISAGVYQEMSARRFKAILLSGGGNDLFDALRQGHILKPHDGDATDIEAWIDPVALGKLRDYVAANYRQIISWRRRPATLNRSTPILLYTYDTPMPRPAKAEFMNMPAAGPWLWPALNDVGAPAALHLAITRRLTQHLAETILEFDAPTDGIHVVDTRGKLVPAQPGSTGDSEDWANEIHPNESGYRKIADALCAKLAELGIA